ncbi:uncharacterized protein LOC109846246 [Asparagus officinalis]|uniref:uncharacterized protein LOC109846246 n=1 Tax=Asparagus officinalis TaxID=4686 RepID=UPI00098E5D09|nr:uncharacterized protein LOC109846246 [Asparagus officinalis]
MEAAATSALLSSWTSSPPPTSILSSSTLAGSTPRSNLPTVELTHGCGCCDVRGPFREALHRIVDSKHNFDCLLIELMKTLILPPAYYFKLKAWTQCHVYQFHN